MTKIKTISIMIAAMFVCVAFASIGGAEYTLDGSVDVEITQYFMGLVHPHINLENESNISFIAEAVTDDNLTYFRVNDSIVIDLDITDNTGRENIYFPRTLMYSVVLVRNDAKLLPLFPLADAFKRIFPVIEIGKSVNVVNSQFGENKSDTIEIPVHYTIANDSVIGTENMTLHLVVMGMLPGDINGVSGLKIVEYKKIALTVDYILPL